MFQEAPIEYDLDQTCRCCLRNMARLTSLDKIGYENDAKADKPTTFGKMLMEIANVQIHSDDGLPQRLCRSCVTALKPAYVLLRTCRESDIKLRAYFEQPVANSVYLEETHFVDVKETHFNPTDVEPKCVPKLIGERVVGQDMYRLYDDAPENKSKVCVDEVLVDVSVNVPENKPSIQSGVSNEECKGSNTGSLRLKCNLCKGIPKIFSDKAAYEGHMSLHARGTGQFVCDICKRRYKHKGGLKNHMVEHSSGQQKVLCPYCGEYFARNSNLDSHIRSKHTNERPYKCDVCSKAFHCAHSMKHHKKTHTSIRPYVCSYCDRTFNKSGNLNRHIRQHTGERPYKCFCGKSFAQASNYKNHYRVHTGEMHKCNVCDFAAPQSKQMLKHRRKFGHFKESVKQPKTED